MKKKMMALFALVAAVALTGYSVSGTYAKYTSELTGSDKARVAKWGVGENISLNLFKDSYDNTVNGSGTKVVAPGTTGEYTFTITNGKAPEVDYTIELTVTKATDDTNGRVRFWVGSESSYEQASNKFENIQGLKTYLESLDETIGTIKAGSNIASKFGEYTIHWEWVFDDESHDADDTTLGNAAANDDEKNVELEIKIVATQVD